jgi:asparagine synthase (glutamine-hydrolysing)
MSMCGIAGYFDLSDPSATRAYLDEMTDILAHRGPDGRGIYARGPVGLGHRRLSIIDLEGGKQPLANEDQSVWITYNGEIYNFQEIRHALMQKGHRFSTRSDTETIVHAYEEYGTDCLDLFRGMFAFAIFDFRHNKLFLARDRIGKKPLYYYFNGKKLVFGSEIKSILQDKSIVKELDPAAVSDYFTYNYVPFPQTIFKNIFKLPPAHFLLAQSSQSHGSDLIDISIKSYWDLIFQPDHSVKEETWCEMIREKLMEATRLRLVSDVPIGAFLSGGVDSSAVVAAMALSSTEQIKTFSIGFEEKEFNELPYARQVAQRYNTDHHEFIVKPDAVEALTRLSWAFDEPFGDSSAIPTYYVSKVAREHVTVILSGDGGDEAFAGYDRYRAALLMSKVDFVPLFLRRVVFGPLSALLPIGTKGKGLLNNLSKGRFERSAALRTFDGFNHVKNLISADIFQKSCYGKNTQYIFLDRYHNKHPGLDYISRLQYEDIKTYLAEDIMTKVDRASMLCGLETRAPILDHKILGLLANVPSHFKLFNGTKKYIFKKSMQQLLPDQVLYRKKMGFNLPLDNWFKGVLYNMMLSLVNTKQFRERGILNTDYINKLLKLHQRSYVDLSDKLWSILFFEKWCQNWLD